MEFESALKLTLHAGERWKMNVTLCLIKQRAMKMCGEVEYYLHKFLCLALEWGECSIQEPVALIPGK
jgi:hypothetical protein